MRISVIIPLKAGVVASLLATSAANGQSASPISGGLRTTIADINPGAPVAAAVPGEKADEAAAAGEAASPNPDAIVTGAIENQRATSTRVLPEAVIDTSDPPAFVAGNALRRTADDAPYAPLGIRAGSFLIFPEVSLGTGYTTNATDAPGGGDAGLAAIAPQVLIRSDWSRHEATLLLRGSQEVYSDGSDNAPEAEAIATLGLALADGWGADLRSSFRYGRDGLSDPDLPGGVDKAPDRYHFNNSAALSGTAGPGVFTFGVSADREAYDEAKSGGKSYDQRDRDNTLYGATLRAGYEVSEAFVPFVEAQLSNRLYDRKKDDNGIRRSSHGDGLRAGFAFDRGPVSSGEIAVGYLRDTFDDNALKSITAFAVDGSLTWSPGHLSTITADVSTAIDPTTRRNSSGSIVYDGRLEYAYAWRANVDLGANAAARYRRYQGIDQIDWTYQLGFDATWKINRYSEIAAGYVHEWRDSTKRSDNYASDTIRVDLRVYR
ncbi:MAG: outer membrane beta-barrel protein [Bauldia sp.]|uniref:outer membrane beta-barrel protein n=1 Tax=Bauldia sp. TaxID=2575872 RepID=UPI001DA41691|nr:outer membrane beta-barrel protein [Bauldia sp.]MCB1496530.1 outer membrane beta-barrel protein [Bauldia sp.]